MLRLSALKTKIPLRNTIHRSIHFRPTKYLSSTSKSAPICVATRRSQDRLSFAWMPITFIITSALVGGMTHKEVFALEENERKKIDNDCVYK